MDTPSAHELAAALADPDRLKLYGRIAAAGTDGVAVDEAADGAPGGARHLARLRRSGLVTPGADGRLRAGPDAFRAVLAARGTAPAGAPARVAQLFSHGRLVAIPARRDARRALLEFLADTLFEPGRTYTEPEVNAAISRYHDDRSTLRRHLVDARLLSRTPDGATYHRPA